MLISDIWIFLMNKFHITFLFLYPLKASENRCFLMNFGGYRKRETSGMRWVNPTFFRKTASCLNRSSHQRCSVRKGVHRNFAKFIGKHLCQILFFNKVAGLRPATLLKETLGRCFPVNFAKFLRTPFCRTPVGDCFYLNSILTRCTQPEVFCKQATLTNLTNLLKNESAQALF